MADKQFDIKLGVNSSGVSKGINQAIGQVTRLADKFLDFKTGIIGLGAAFGAFLKEQAAWADDLKDTSSALETTVRNLQALKYMAASFGHGDFSEVSAALGAIKKEQSEALGGKPEAVKNFEAIGISIEELKRSTPEELFLRISKAVESGAVSAANYANVLKIIGEAGKDLVADMKDGAATIAEDFRNSSLIVQRSMVDALDNAGNAANRFWATIKAAGRKAGAGTAAGLLGVGKLGIAAIANLFDGDKNFKGSKSRGIAQWFTSLRDRMLDSRAAQWDDGNGEALELQGQLEARLNQLLGLRQKEDNLAAEELKKLREKNAERAREVVLSKMSAEERNKALGAEKKELQSQMDKTKNALEAERIRSKIIELDSKIAAPKDEKEKKESIGQSGVDRPPSDHLQRIGLIVGTPSVVGGGMRSEQYLADLNRRADAQLKVLTAISMATVQTYNQAVKLHNDLTREP